MNTDPKLNRSTDMRLSQPPSMFQLPPLPQKSKMSVLNLFELSRNFNTRGQAWLMERYIQQQEPVANVHGMAPHTPAPTSAQNWLYKKKGLQG